MQSLTRINPLAYDQDFYEWTQQMAAAVRDGNWSALDVENLVEEIENLGKRDRRALKSRLEVLLMHLLKWQFQPDQRTGSWRGTLLEQRLRIQDLLADSPSLRHYLIELLEECHGNAVLLAAAETGLAIAIFPTECPYSLGQILDLDYFPL
jgi:Domain of unknown function DUF29